MAVTIRALGGVQLTVPRVLCLALLAALMTASSSAAASPCAKNVLADWRDNGRIDRVYALPCYDQAIDAIPADLLPYADADEVIGRALQSALREQGVNSPRSPGTPRQPSGEPPSPPRTTAPPVNTSATTALPLPLIVLGGCALVLLATGGLGWLTRRRRDLGSC